MAATLNLVAILDLNYRTLRVQTWFSKEITSHFVCHYIFEVFYCIYSYISIQLISNKQLFIISTENNVLVAILDFGSHVGYFSIYESYLFKANYNFKQSCQFSFFYCYVHSCQIYSYKTMDYDCSLQFWPPSLILRPQCPEF